MNKYFKILSIEPRFEKMLILELCDNGLILSVGSFPDAERNNLFTIIDIDTCNKEDIEASARISTVIGYTRKAENTNEFCSAVFLRPFLVPDFIAAFGNLDTEKTSVIQKRKETHKKPHFLTVDGNCAVWGDTKIPLSEYECKVLSLLCENRGETVERERIYSLLGAEAGNMGDVYICHLRRKIDNKLGLKLIYTIRGKGYMLKN